MDRRRGAPFIVAVFSCAVLAYGCAAIPIAAVSSFILEAGGGALVKTGTEYTATGTAVRTFVIPTIDVHAAILETFRRTQIDVTKDTVSSKGELTIAGESPHRKVRTRLIPVTPALTSMELRVKRNFIAGDKSMASELLAEIERTLAENPEFAARLVDVSYGGAPH